MPVLTSANESDAPGVASTAQRKQARALRDRRRVRRYEDVAVPVVTADYLCAIALQSGRVKDFQRVYSLLEAGCVDASALSRLIASHGLQERWNAYARRYA